MLDCEVVQTSTLVDCAVIWLHGLGADGHDFAGIVDELELPHTMGVRFIFPHAPMLSVTLNGGMSMPAWYDIESLDLEQNLDEAGVERSSKSIAELIERERQRGIPSHRIILAGFSQGGLIALHYGLRASPRLGGIMALSTYDPTITQLTPELRLQNKSMPVFMAHGTYDPVVHIELGQKAYEQLTLCGIPAVFKKYAMPHSVCPAELNDISQWLQQTLGVVA